MEILFREPAQLKHIEKFSARRVTWLCDKISKEGVWIKPLALDSQHNLVLDGQHRMEVALCLGLTKVPVVIFNYPDVPLRSLREKYQFDWQEVTRRALTGDIYPYKTVKHDFMEGVPACRFTLHELGYKG